MSLKDCGACITLSKTKTSILVLVIFIASKMFGCSLFGTTIISNHSINYCNTLSSVICLVVAFLFSKILCPNDVTFKIYCPSLFRLTPAVKGQFFDVVNMYSSDPLYSFRPSSPQASIMYDKCVIFDHLVKEKLKSAVCPSTELINYYNGNSNTFWISFLIYSKLLWTCIVSPTMVISTKIGLIVMVIFLWPSTSSIFTFLSLIPFYFSTKSVIPSAFKCSNN